LLGFKGDFEKRAFFTGIFFIQRVVNFPARFLAKNNADFFQNL